MEPHHHRQLYVDPPFMSSSEDRPFHTRLDATEGREVVFCHFCSAEWFRDENGLVCPACESDITEIVTLENDPRPDNDADGGEDDAPFDPFGALHHHHHHHHAHQRGNDSPGLPSASFQYRPGGNYFYNQTIWDGSQPPGAERAAEGHGHDPGDVVINQFYQLVQNLSRPRPTHYNPPGAAEEEHGAGEDAPIPRPHVTTTVFSRGPISVTRTEIRSPPQARGDTAEARPPAFDDLYGTFFGDFSPPHGGPGGGGGRPTAHRVGIGASLADILNMFINPGGRHGDAVHSQEALDQIITQLMEANPQSNAAPPASDAVLQSLPRKTVDDAMLEAEGGEAECTICIDNAVKGDTVLVLPCKHWFHENCATLWLKEHNTCPICRTTVEMKDEPRAARAAPAGGDAGRAASGSGSGGGDSQHRPRSAGAHDAPPRVEPSHSSTPHEGWSSRIFSTRNHMTSPNSSRVRSPDTTAPPSRSPSSRRRVYTDTFATSSSSTPNPDGSHHRSPRFHRTDTSASASSGHSVRSYMERGVGTRLSRRHSRSPTSPDPSRPTRVRSPHHSASSSRDRVEGAAGLSSHNPLTWLRNAMDRHPSSGGSGHGSSHHSRDRDTGGSSGRGHS